MKSIHALAVVALAVFFASACRQPASSSVANQALVAPTPMVTATVGSADTVQYPVDVGYSDDAAARASAAAAESDYLDSVCSQLVVSSSLSAFRPNGTGCVRHANVFSFSGAQ